VLDTVLLKSFTVVLLVVKSHNHSDSELLEDGNVVFRGKSSVTISISWLVRRSREGDELTRNDPVKITIFNLLIEFVVSEVESLDVEPLELNGVFKTSKTVEDAASIRRIGVTSISVLSKRRLKLGERFPGFFGSFTKNNDAEAAH